MCTGIDRVTSLCEAQIVAAQACSVLVGSVEIFSGLITLYQTLPQLASPPSSPTTTEPPLAPTPPIWPLRDTCDTARERWHEAATTARERAAALGRCLEGDTFKCRPVAAALAPALTALSNRRPGAVRARIGRCISHGHWRCRTRGRVV